ncbi:MAG: ferredoxin--NADP reductase [Polaribacter sp.]|nr:ferredoxin--NADP reductase [Polaribacter sp.]
MSTFHKLTIQQIIKETPDAVSILFEIPAGLKKQFSFVAGQYITIKKELEETEVRRAYSICASPNSNQLKVAIKSVEKGFFSIFATSKLKEGDILEVAEPEGKFMLAPVASKNYIAFAAGSGITPVISMVKVVLENEPSSTFTLVYGNKSAESTIFKNELDALSEKYTSQFNLHYVFSKELRSDSEFGRINKERTNLFVKNIHNDLSFDAAFLCGPEAMIHTVSETLQENGMHEEAIYFELFTASDADNGIDIPDGKSEITVLLDDEETTFTMEKTDDILAASLRHQLDAPYSCQGGVCSTCIAKVTEGKAIMSKNTILTDDELENGFILTCQAHPTTSKIKIDFDDV